MRRVLAWCAALVLGFAWSLSAQPPSSISLIRLADGRRICYATLLSRVNEVQGCLAFADYAVLLPEAAEVQ